MPQYRLTKALLQQSENSFIKKHTFLTATNLTRPARTPLKQLEYDAQRDSVLLQNNRIEKTAEFNQNELNILFNPTNSEQLAKHYEQTLLSLVSAAALEPHDVSRVKLVNENKNPPAANLYSHAGHVFIKSTNQNIRLTKSNDVTKPEYQTLNGSIETLFKLTETGFELLEINTDNAAIRDMLMGREPEYKIKEKKVDLIWFTQRDPNNWSWLQRNFSIFEPQFSNSYIEPLTHRCRNAFHHIFNDDNPHQSDTAAFFDWPEGNENGIYKFFKYLLTGRFLSIVKNTVKLFVEFLPACIEEGCRLICDISRNTLLHSRLTNTEKFIAYAGLAVCGTLHFVAKGVRQIAQRVTSPVRSVIEAYRAGGVLLAAASILVSVAAAAGVATIALPYVAAKAGIGIVGAGIKTALNFVNHLGLSPLGVAAATLVVAPLVPLIGIGVGLKKLWQGFKNWRKRKRINNVINEINQLTPEHAPPIPASALVSATSTTHAHVGRKLNKQKVDSDSEDDKEFKLPPDSHVAPPPAEVTPSTAPVTESPAITVSPSPIKRS